MARWVKLPEGAQVTLSSDEYEATQGMSWVSKAWILVLIIGVLWLWSATSDSDKAKPATTPHPTTTSAPAQAPR